MCVCASVSVYFWCVFFVCVCACSRSRVCMCITSRMLVVGSQEVRGALARAKKIAEGGVPVLVNVRIGRTNFREGSLSV
jgi:hypothetical protein